MEKLPDISKWNFVKVKNMGKICYNCKSLKSLPKGFDKKDLKNVEYNEGAFDGCNLEVPQNFSQSSGCLIY